MAPGLSSQHEGPWGAVRAAACGRKAIAQATGSNVHKTLIFSSKPLEGRSKQVCEGGEAKGGRGAAGVEMRAAGVGSARCSATCGGSALGQGLTGSPGKQCGHVGGHFTGPGLVAAKDLNPRAEHSVLGAVRLLSPPAVAGLCKALFFSPSGPGRAAAPALTSAGSIAAQWPCPQSPGFPRVLPAPCPRLPRWVPARGLSSSCAHLAPLLPCQEPLSHPNFPVLFPRAPLPALPPGRMPQQVPGDAASPCPHRGLPSAAFFPSPARRAPQPCSPCGQSSASACAQRVFFTF